jgi:beta-fructofuranosidase
MLRVPDRRILSGRILDDGTDFHLFFSHAPLAAADRETAIGHAVSTDLRWWDPHGDVVRPIEGPAWDDLAALPGTAIRGPDGRWRLFYAGISRAEGGLVQRIGIAASADLISWVRAQQPALSADPFGYEKLGLTGWPDEVWRNPFVFADPSGDGFHMLITARAAGGGVVGHAHSTDLDTWEVRPPLTEPAGFDVLEDPHASIVDGQPLLVFSSPVPASAGVWVASGESRLGPWDIVNAQHVEKPGFESGQLVRDHSGRWMLVGTLNGEIADPVPVRYGDGGLDALPMD